MTEFQLIGIAPLNGGARYRLEFVDRAGTVVGYDVEIAPVNEFIAEIRRDERFVRECAPVDYENSWVPRVVGEFAALRDYGVSPAELTVRRDREYRLVVAGKGGVRVTFDATVPYHNATADQVTIRPDADAVPREAAPADRGGTSFATAMKQAIAAFDWQHSEPLTLTPAPERDGSIGTDTAR